MKQIYFLQIHAIRQLKKYTQVINIPAIIVNNYFIGRYTKNNVFKCFNLHVIVKSSISLETLKCCKK